MCLKGSAGAAGKLLCLGQTSVSGWVGAGGRSSGAQSSSENQPDIGLGSPANARHQSSLASSPTSDMVTQNFSQFSPSLQSIDHLGYNWTAIESDCFSCSDEIAFPS